MLRPLRCAAPLQRKTASHAEWCETRAGVRQGPSVMRYASGPISETGTYDRGQKHGDWKSWGYSFMHINLLTRAELRKWLKAERHALRKQVSAVYPFRAGKLHGVQTQWLRGGIKVEEGLLADGFKHGVWCHWDETGRLLARDQLVRGTGTYTTWWADGKPMQRIELRNGLRHGRYQQWWKTGQELFDKHFVAGKQHGEQKQWSTEGTLLGSYKMNHGTGTETTWNLDGSMRTVTERVDGLQHGSSVIYDKAGSVLWKERWQNGKRLGHD